MKVRIVDAVCKIEIVDVLRELKRVVIIISVEMGSRAMSHVPHHVEAIWGIKVVTCNKV